jgi:hypothetical protein
MAYVPTLEAALSGLVTGDRIVKLVPGASSPYFGLPEVLIHATVSNVSVRGISFHVFGWHQVRARAHACAKRRRQGVISTNRLARVCLPGRCTSDQDEANEGGY